MSGPAASRAAFVSLAPRHRIVHLATHGFVAPEEDWSIGDRVGFSGEPLQPHERVFGYTRGLLSGIVFAGANLEVERGQDRAVLTAAELAGVDLSGCELAVLSACETNVGPRYFGEVVTGLNRALQLAGARNTINSLWKVSDEGTAALFDAFYEALWSRRVTVPEAFTVARRAVREAGHGPRVWAGFVLYVTGSELGTGG